MKKDVKEVEIKRWKWKILATAMIIGFVIGVGFTIWIKYTLVAQGVYKSIF